MSRRRDPRGFSGFCHACGVAPASMAVAWRGEQRLICQAQACFDSELNRIEDEARIDREMPSREEAERQRVFDLIEGYDPEAIFRAIESFEPPLAADRLEEKKAKKKRRI